jgi:PAS domain-containing protein
MFFITILSLAAIGTIVACLIAFRPRQQEDYTTVMLQNMGIPWCVLPLDASGQIQKKCFVCSNEFARIVGSKLPSWGGIASALGADRDSPFQAGMRKLLKTKEPVTVRVVVNDRTHEVSATLYVSQERQSVLLTLHDVTEAYKVKERYDEALDKINDLLGILNALPFPIWTRKNNGNITFCNVAYAKILETQPYQVLSHQWELIDGPNAKDAKSLYKDVLQEKSAKAMAVKKKFKGKEREYRILEDVVAKIGPSNDEFAVVGSAIDTSEVVMSDRDIDLYQNTLDIAEWSFCIVNRAAQVVLHNVAFEQTFGISLAREESFVDDVLNRLRGEEKLPGNMDFPTLKKLCTEWIAHEGLPFHEMWHMPSGAILNVSVTAYQNTHIMITLKDITQILNIESRYKSLQSVWNAVIDQSKDAVLIIGLDHRIQRCSACVASVLDKDASALIGLSVKEFLRMFASQHVLHIWQSNLEDAIELRNPHSVTITTQNHTLLCEYMPLPDGWHMLRFSVCPQESHTNTLFGQYEEHRKVSRGN